MTTFTITWRTERGELRGEPVQDMRSILNRLLPIVSEQSFYCLHFIDYQGLTVFGQHQMKVFRPEWERLMEQAKGEEDRVWLEHVDRLAHLCEQTFHTQLWFEGD